MTKNETFTLSRLFLIIGVACPFLTALPATGSAQKKTHYKFHCIEVKWPLIWTKVAFLMISVSLFHTEEFFPTGIKGRMQTFDAGDSAFDVGISF